MSTEITIRDKTYIVLSYPSGLEIYAPCADGEGTERHALIECTGDRPIWGCTSGHTLAARLNKYNLRKLINNF